MVISWENSWNVRKNSALTFPFSLFTHFIVLAMKLRLTINARLLKNASRSLSFTVHPLFFFICEYYYIIIICWPFSIMTLISFTIVSFLTNFSVTIFSKLDRWNQLIDTAALKFITLFQNLQASRIVREPLLSHQQLRKSKCDLTSSSHVEGMR